MRDIDIFNGDADGICSLIQLRLCEPRAALLITGVKRDISLFSRVSARSGDRITALDISFDRNRDNVIQALDAGASVFYCDHHFSGDIPSHPALSTLINTSSEICTSVLVNGYLKSSYCDWAAVGAFGDNLIKTAIKVLKPQSYNQSKVDILQKLGIYINNKSYGLN